MPIVRSSVSVLNLFPEITERVSALARDSVEAAAEAGGRAAAEIAAKRRLPIRLVDVRPTGDGWEAGFECPHVAAWFQNYGTLGSRQRALKRSPSTTRTRAAGTGIKPLYFLNGGKHEGRKRLLENIDKGLPR